ncbi:MAG TPA: hypothetical protein VMH39_10925 [Gemmatimonadaceae bacterium]|nr:hypothetical protein [Gemmatimonadaceae bacterium]
MGSSSAGAGTSGNGQGAGGTSVRREANTDQAPVAARVALLVFGVCVVAACNGAGFDTPGNTGPYPYTDVPAPPNGVAQFTVLPTAIDSGFTLTALGNLNPPGHTVPTDHVYFYAWDLATNAQTGGSGTRTVYMPATGAVTFLLQTPGVGDWKIECRVTDNFFFYLDHVLLTTPLTIGEVLPAGAAIGTTDPGGTLDLGAFDLSVTHAGFLDTARYPVETQHYLSPWAYFTPDLQAQIYPHVYRAPTAADKDGKVDFDVAGRLVGVWYLQGMPADSSYEPYGWPKTIAFVYDYYDPSLVRIAVGGTVGPAGVWGIDSTAPPPKTVSVASGVVTYRLYDIFDWHPQQGVMLVQMVNDSTLKVEMFPGNLGSTAEFDGNAFTFVR